MASVIRGSDNFDSGAGDNIVQTHLITTSSQVVTINVANNVTGLNATITPTTTSKRVKVTVRWAGEFSSANNYDVTWGINRGATAVGNPAADGLRSVNITCMAMGYSAPDATSTPDTAFYSYIDSPSTTSATTYHATCKPISAGTLYNQRTTADNNGGNYERLTSTIILEEID